MLADRCGADLFRMPACINHLKADPHLSVANEGDNDFGHVRVYYVGDSQSAILILF